MVGVLKEDDLTCVCALQNTTDRMLYQIVVCLILILHTSCSSDLMQRSYLHKYAVWLAHLLVEVSNDEAGCYGFRRRDQERQNNSRCPDCRIQRTHPHLPFRDTINATHHTASWCAHSSFLRKKLEAVKLPMILILVLSRILNY